MNEIDRIYLLIDDLHVIRNQSRDASQKRNLALAITHLEDAALRIGPPLWYRPNPGVGSPETAQSEDSR